MFSYKKDNVVTNVEFDNLRVGFDNFDRVVEAHGQAMQDIFALVATNGKVNGRFLDLGSHHPIKINNTYLLETAYDWTGTCIDVDSSLMALYDGVRNCEHYCADVQAFDFSRLSGHIDFLSFDLEPPDVTMNAMYKFPFDKVKFSVITYEHDAYRDEGGTKRCDESRRFFTDLGYDCLCSNVMHDAIHPFEDWYVHPDYVDVERLESLRCNGKPFYSVLLK